VGKRGKKVDVTETKGNPVIRALKNAGKTTDADRLAKDVEIVDKGWNNTAEGQEDLRTKGASRNKSTGGKHKKP
jgi:hypothetical protein